MTYPSSVNRGYFSYLARIMLMIPPLFVSILCQSRLFLLPTKIGDKVEIKLSIHPLSIEAISPTLFRAAASLPLHSVSILCQSRLFLLHRVLRPHCRSGFCIHPLSIEAISPTWNMVDGDSELNPEVSILCQSRLFLLRADSCRFVRCCYRIHPLSIEAISPTPSRQARGMLEVMYPSSVNRGYFSYNVHAGEYHLQYQCKVSILCQSRLFLLQRFPHKFCVSYTGKRLLYH